MTAGPATPVAPAASAPGAPTAEQLAAAATAEARLAALLKLGDVTQANAVTGIYGDSGTGKSTLAQTAVEYAWTRYRKISRYVIIDPGGFGNKLLRLIRLGIAQVYNPTNHVEPFETMEDLSLGYWPETIEDPYTGYAAPDVKLVPPQETTWGVYCPQDHLVKTVRDKRALNGFSIQCPTCKLVTTPQNWRRVEELTTRSPWIKHVGLYIFDSGTAAEDWVMEDMAARAAKADPNIKDGNALSGTGARIVTPKYAFGANTQQHYGFAQNRIRQWIKNSRTIPGQVLPAIFTFLELRATDDAKNVAIFGPKIAGNAKTSDVPSWLGNCLHTSKELDQKGRPEHRLWLVNHTDAGSIVPHLAKTRAEPGTLPPYLADGPDEAPFTRFSLGYFFDQLESALHLGSEQDVKDFPDAPLFQPLEIEGHAEIIGRKDLSGAETGVRGGPTRAAVSTGTAATARPAPGRSSAPTPAGPGVKPAAPPAAAGHTGLPPGTVAAKPAAPAAPAAAGKSTPAGAPAVPSAPPVAARPATPPVTPPAAAPMRATVRPMAAPPTTPPPPGGKKP